MSSLEKKNSVTKSKLSRRKFLGLLGATATGAVIFEACGVPEEELIVERKDNYKLKIEDGVQLRTTVAN